MSMMTGRFWAMDHTIFAKLHERNNYLNKAQKRIYGSNTTGDVPRKKRRTAAKAGCSYWEPEQSSENAENITEKIQKLNSIQDINNYNKKDVYLLSDETYAAQRSFINNEVPAITVVKEKWPIFVQEVWFWHYHKLKF